MFCLEFLKIKVCYQFFRPFSGGAGDRSEAAFKLKKRRLWSAPTPQHYLEDMGTCDTFLRYFAKMPTVHSTYQLVSALA